MLYVLYKSKKFWIKNIKNRVLFLFGHSRHAFILRNKVKIYRTLLWWFFDFTSLVKLSTMLLFYPALQIVQCRTIYECKGGLWTHFCWFTQWRLFFVFIHFLTRSIGLSTMRSLKAALSCRQQHLPLKKSKDLSLWELVLYSFFGMLSGWAWLSEKEELLKFGLWSNWRIWAPWRLPTKRVTSKMKVLYVHARE